MSRKQKAKVELENTSELLDIITILRDVASNRFYNSAKRKERFLEFAEYFVEFFMMVSLADVRHPLVHSDSEKIALLLITSEMGFMGEITAKIIKNGIQEAEKYKDVEFIVVGYKGEQKLKQSVRPGTQIKLFRDVEEHGLFKTTLMIKEYIIKEVIEGRLGKVFAVYPFAVNFNTIKPKVIKLLPSEELLAQQKEIKDTVEKVIVESAPGNIIGYLANLWLTSRIFEILEDCVIAGFAAQAQQLEAAMDRLKKEKKGFALTYKKAKRADIDKSLKEVFTAILMMKK
jgi:ATP synthase F1 gamma subunit